MDIVVLKAFESGQIARIEGDPSRAIIHFTRALEIFHATVGSQYDPSFWARILFCRAEAHLLYGHYAFVEKDITQALAACPEQSSDLVSSMHNNVTQWLILNIFLVLDL